MNGWYFRPDPNEIVMHGTWPYGDAVADVCVLNPNRLHSCYEVLFGRPDHPGEYDYPSSEATFSTMEAAKLYAERKVSLTWDPDPMTPPAALATLATLAEPSSDSTDDLASLRAKKRSNVA